MGRIYKDPLSSIATSIVLHKGLEQFIETGTYKGYSLLWAQHLFRNIVTIEIDYDFYKEVSSQFSNSNITFLLGDSRSCLRHVDFDKPSLIWLDAHSGGGNFGTEDNCPLMEELDIILGSPINHYIMIDDARAFCWPLSSPFDYKKWPDLNDIFSKVLDRYWVSINYDVLFLIPLNEKEEFQKLFIM